MSTADYTVTGSHSIAGIEPGGTVTLDGEKVNVEALIDAGQIEPVKPARKVESKKTEKGVTGASIQSHGRDDSGS